MIKIHEFERRYLAEFERLMVEKHYPAEDARREAADSFEEYDFDEEETDLIPEQSAKLDFEEWELSIQDDDAEDDYDDDDDWDDEDEDDEWDGDEEEGDGYDERDEGFF